jgi:hypothetical protein
MIDDLIQDIADFAQVGAHKLKERIWEAGFYSLVVQDSHRKGEQPVIECRVQGWFEELPEYVREHLQEVGTTRPLERICCECITAISEFGGVRVEITGVKRI